DGSGAQQRRQAGAEPSCLLFGADPEGSEEYPGRQGISQADGTAESPRRLPEDGDRPASTVDAVYRQDRSLVARPRGPPPGRLRQTGPPGADGAAILGVQSGLCASPE